MSEKEVNPKRKFNKIWLGLLIGLILPVLVVYVFYLIKSRPGADFVEYITYMKKTGTFLPIFSLATVSNLLPFYLFNYLHYLYSSRGILISVFLYVIFVVILKFA
ncbi:MAG: hypothetical protein PF590_05795 [Candidatus Delongbacteria bacterium]|jgi:hypothetical protein|nr:hypothetical protein [Candidatus Delongbacteria bacterium]